MDRWDPRRTGLGRGDTLLDPLFNVSDKISVLLINFHNICLVVSNRLIELRVVTNIKYRLEIQQLAVVLVYTFRVIPRQFLE